jgi:PAS domain S-box-containing protein
VKIVAGSERTALSDGALAKISSLEEELRNARELLVAAAKREADKVRYFEAELRRRSHVLDVVLSNIPDLICTFDLDGNFTYANPALLGVWQRSLEEIIGKNTFDLGYPPDLAARIQGEVKAVIQSKLRVVNHTPFTGANGDTRVYEYIFSPVLAGDRSLVEVTCTARDITDRERMEKALAESEEKLQQVFAQAPVAIVVLRGPEFVVEMANPSYQALLPEKQLVGRRFADIVPELGQDVWDAFHRVLETGEPFVANEWHVPYDQNGDGVIEDVWFNVVYHPLRDTNGQVTGMVAVSSDVSVQVRARRELERANRELEEFAYVVSHDLQEPLRMVGIYTEMLLNRFAPDDAKARVYAGFVRQGVDRMDQLIQDLLAYSRVVHSDEGPPANADLNEAWAQALMTLESRIGEASARLIVEPLPVVRGETSQWVHVFQNLLSNSLKYRHAGLPPEIHVSAQRNGANWVISVQDQGIGFEPQYAQRIFGLFKRLHKDEFSGTGLGLAICQRIVERYGGRIWAEGRPGEGSTFHIVIPGNEAQ